MNANVKQKFFWLAAGVIAGGVFILYLLNPAEWQVFPRCMFHELTGLNCPGCGATRAMHALLHGEFLVAFRDNALLIVSLVLFGVWCIIRLCRPPSSAILSPRWIGIAGTMAVFFAIWRNLPCGAWWNP